MSDLLKHVDECQPLAVFLQSPYPEHYPAWFLDAAEHFPMAYAGYGLSLLTWLAGHFEVDPVLKSSYLFAAGRYDLDGYTEHVPKANVVLTGNPLLYDLRASLSGGVPSTGDGATVLWAPHWTKTFPGNSRGYARWADTVGAMLDWTASHPNVRLVFRPHPILRAALTSYVESGTSPPHREAAKALDLGVDRPALESLRELIGRRNVEVSDRSMLDDIRRCDALVTDGIAIIGYWSATGKPIAVFRDAASPRFNEDGEALTAVADVVADSTELTDWLQAWWAGPASLSRERIKVSQEIHPAFDRSPVEIWRGTLPKDTFGRRVRRSLAPLNGARRVHKGF